MFYNAYHQTGMFLQHMLTIMGTQEGNDYVACFTTMNTLQKWRKDGENLQPKRLVR